MNVDEIFAGKPEKVELQVKRKSRIDLDDSLKSARPKKSRFEPERSDVHDARTVTTAAATTNRTKPLSDEQKEELLKSIESEPTGILDEAAVKKLLLQFEKKVHRNQEMRVKFPDQADKFMESEIELNDAIQELHVVTTVPDLYDILVSLKSINTMIQLIGHDNTDISIAVIDLLQELTDIDSLNEDEDGAKALVEAMITNQVVAQLVQNMDRLDETSKEEFDGVHNSLAIIENMTDLESSVCVDTAKQGILPWIFKRIRVKGAFDANKLYASEILAILMQNSDEVRELLGEHDGIDVLLQQLASYKRHDPHGSEECEYMENLFDCLCSCLSLNSNKERFLKGEGLQLMNLMLREKKTSRNSALKVLDHSMSGRGPEVENNCQKFIEILGLRSLFPLFMKTPRANKKGPSKSQLEEHIISICSSLLKHSSSQQKARLLAKFTENDHEKVDRLMELHFKYFERVRQVDNDIDVEKIRLKRKFGEVAEEEEDNFYLRRLDGGLFSLQQIDYIMIDIANSAVPTVKQRITHILNMRGDSVKSIRFIMREYAGNIGEGSSDSAAATSDQSQGEQGAAAAEKKRLIDLLEKF